MATKADIIKAEENLIRIQERINTPYEYTKNPLLNSLLYRVGTFCFDAMLRLSGDSIAKLDLRNISRARVDLQTVIDDYNFSRGYD